MHCFNSLLDCVCKGDWDLWGTLHTFRFKFNLQTFDLRAKITYCIYFKKKLHITCPLANRYNHWTIMFQIDTSVQIQWFKSNIETKYSCMLISIYIRLYGTNSNMTCVIHNKDNKYYHWYTLFWIDTSVETNWSNWLLKHIVSYK